MFGTQNDNKPLEIKPEPVFDPKTIPVHTMQDDLDMLSGKIKDTASISFESGDAGSAQPAGVGYSDNSPFSQPSASAPQASIPMRNVEIPRPVKTPQVPVEIPRGYQDSQLPEDSSGFGKTFGVFAVIVIILGLLGGGYYFYMTRYNNPPEEAEVIPNDIIPEEKPVEIPKEPIISEKFSAEKPNYLMLDTETATSDSLQKLFVQKAGEISADGKRVPIEFVVTDSNNNPIAFKIFAQLMGVVFSPSFLSNLQDDFSLFIFMDKENTRFGLKLTAKDPVKAKADLKTEEKMLAKNLKPLFLGEETNGLTGAFSDNQYKGFAIRYFNLNEQGSLSVDYFLDQEKVFLATSKNTAWAIIDKIANLGQ